MSDDKVTVELKDREVLGKGLTALRAGGTVPAVVHERGKPSIHVMGDYLKLVKAYSKAGKHHPVELKIGSKQRLALIKDVDFEPTKHRMRHVVFQAIKQNEKVAAEIPVVLVGDEIPAEIAGLMVLPQLDTVQVEALPHDLPDKLEVDATKLAEVGDRLTVADLNAPASVTILTEPEQSLAVVEMPKDQLAEADAAKKELEEAGAEPTEGETDEAKEETKAAEGETESESAEKAPEKSEE